jgi:hypothetical protein
MAHAAYCLRNSLFLLAALLTGPASAAMSEEEMFFKGVADVNDGDLKFLAKAPDAPIHHHQNRITLNQESLLSGWAKLEQCHRHLDPVPDMQIVYGSDRVRNIAVLRIENIDRAWVHENTVQMEQVARDALICISAETRALAADGENRFVLTNGPYMRRFLDGYYPMRVSVEVILETNRLSFLDSTPAPQPGFQLHQEGNRIGFEALFEGMLRTSLRFMAAP